MQSYELNGVNILELDAEGALLTSEANALDIIGESYGTEADVIVIPVSRLAPDFLDLGNGILGAVIQKFTNYQLRVAFMGDISGALADSKSLRDFVRETNKGGRILFARDREELASLIG